jgi:hypothetical protein
VLWSLTMKMNWKLAHKDDLRAKAAGHLVVHAVFACVEYIFLQRTSGMDLTSDAAKPDSKNLTALPTTANGQASLR